MAIGAVALAFSTVALDAALADPWLRSHGWVYAGGGEGASAVLEAIAGSMITIAGVVFSITLVALSLASSQFGPRLLRNFMRDSANQVILGTFVATFLYCLLVLRTIRLGDDPPVVPHLSVSIAVIMAVASMGVLIYFIHHVSVSIQADEVVAAVSVELNSAIDRLFPDQLGHALSQKPNTHKTATVPDEFAREAGPVFALQDGYLQLIDADGLMRLTTKEDILVRIEYRPGHYVVAGTPLVYAWPGDRVNDELTTKINSAFILGNQRTPSQDVEFAINQLVEIAVRALSPSVNDPFTAIRCVDRLGSALCRLGQRETPSAYRHDDEDKLRVIAPPDTFPGILNAAFNQIRQFARNCVAVTIRLLETLSAISYSTHRPEDRVALRRHGDMILRGARTAIPEQEDLYEIEDRYRSLIQLLDTLK